MWDDVTLFFLGSALHCFAPLSSALQGRVFLPNLPLVLASLCFLWIDHIQLWQMLLRDRLCVVFPPGDRNFSKGWAPCILSGHIIGFMHCLVVYIRICTYIWLLLHSLRLNLEIDVLHRSPCVSLGWETMTVQPWTAPPKIAKDRQKNAKKTAKKSRWIPPTSWAVPSHLPSLMRRRFLMETRRNAMSNWGLQERR